MEPQAKQNGPPPRFVFNMRSILYALAFLFIFSFTVAELGLVSYYLHKYGNTYEHYPSKQVKHVLGLLLCATLISLLVSLSHYWLSVGFVAFTSFILAVFFSTGAGVIQRTTPFKGTNCGHATERQWPAQWQPYAGECKNIVAIQALGWGLAFLYLSMLIGSFFYMFSIHPKPTPGRFYSV
ncbi:hypothetical protein BJ165DRAFT_159450 [Panaeolus papilionaceus]|nr:hypothetical protein BJ165DRAFT_159450 [Panaeolus papilionaceus]